MARTDPLPPAPAIVRLLGVVLWSSVALGLAAIALGCVMVVADASSHTDEFDGLAAFFGVLVAAVGVVWTAVHGALALWLRRTRLRSRPPTAVGLVSAAAGAVLLATPSIVLDNAGVLLAMLCVTAPVAVTGLLSALSSGRTRVAATPLG